MGKVIGIGPKGITAAASDGIPTFWVGGIVGLDFTGQQLSARVQEACAVAGECRLIVDSVGGLASDAFSFYDYVRNNGLKVWAEGYGRVASAATVIMGAAGRQRSSLSPNCEYLPHEAHGGEEAEVERYNQRLANLYAELSGTDAKEWRKIMAEDLSRDASWAKKMKLVGEVLQHAKVAAQFIPMEQEQKPEVVETEAKPADPEQPITEEVEVEIPVTAAEGVAAAWSGKLKAKVSVNAELRTAMTNAIQEAKDTRAQLQERVDEVTALNEKLTKAQEDAAAANEAKAKAEGELATMNSKLGELTAEVEKLKKAPLAEAEATPRAGTNGVKPAAEVKGTERVLSRDEQKQKEREAKTAEAFGRFKTHKA